MGKSRWIKKAPKRVRKVVRRLKIFGTISKNFKRFGHVLKSIGQAVENRL